MLTSSFPVICNLRLPSRQLFWSYSNSKSAFRLLTEVACVLRMLNWSANCRHELPASGSFIKATLCRSVSAFRFFDMITLDYDYYWPKHWQVQTGDCVISGGLLVDANGNSFDVQNKPRMWECIRGSLCTLFAQLWCSKWDPEEKPWVTPLYPERTGPSV